MKIPKAVWLAIALALICVRAFAADAPAASPASAATNGPSPKIHFDTLVYDFGKVVTGETIHHTFIVSNAGDAKLIISNVRGTCSCTTAGAWTKEIEPGKTGEVPLQINTTYLHGAIHKLAIVTSNDKSQPNVNLTLLGATWSPIDVNPPIAYMRLTSATESNAPTVVRITNKTGQPVTLSDVQSSIKLITAEIKTVEPGNLFDLLISAVPPVPPGNTPGTITIHTSATNMPTISITAIAMAPRPAVVVTPEKMVIPAAFGSPASSHTVLIQSTIPTPLVLTNASVNAKGVEVRIKELQAGRQFYIMLAFPAGFQASNDTELSVQSNFPQFPVIKVPITQLPSPAGAGASAKKD